MTVTDWLLLINGTCVALSTAIVYVVTRLRKQLDEVHSQVNGNLSDVKRELSVVRSELRREKEK